MTETKPLKIIIKNTWVAFLYQTQCQQTCWQGWADQDGSPNEPSWCFSLEGILTQWHDRYDTLPEERGEMRLNEICSTHYAG